MKRRIIALLTCVCLILSLSACGKGASKSDKDSSEKENTAKSSVVNIPYSSTDSFNPFKAKTSLNCNVATLIFDSLFYMDNEYNLQSCLADNYEISGKTCAVTIKKVKFSDGSALTADDVIYSFNAAKKGSNRYAAQLNTVTATATDSSSVTFTCTKNDPYMINLLTFPIIKKDSDTLTDDDKVEIPPIGCGRYILSKDKTSLTANKNWHGGELNVKTVRLVNAPDSESLSHAVEIGAIDIYYTNLSNGTILRMSGERQNVNLNNLVYIGINHSNNMLVNNNMRQAISAALDREKLCESAFFTNAVAAKGIFHPAWEPTKSIQSIETSANNKIAIENLEQIGYNKKDNGIYYENTNGDSITLRLLVNGENKFRLNAANMVVEQLKNVGIKINIEAVSYEKYVARLKEGSFDLYIGEVNILDNMDVSEILLTGGKSAYGIKAENESIKTTQNMIKNFYKGEAAITDIAAYAISEMPIIPLCYRTGVQVLGKNVKAEEYASSGNIYYPLNKMKIK